MSLDVYLRLEVDAGSKDGPETHTFYDSNITHNLGPMWMEAGVYESLYMSEGKLACEIAQTLENGVRAMEKDPPRFKKHNSPNGWGLYEHALPWLREYAKACRDYPKAKVHISK